MIEFKNVAKYYSDHVVAVDNINLTVKKEETLVLIGLSGCGKTTTLKMINRLIEQDSGDIYINNQNIKDINPISLRRNIGYVIQNIGLFPHMTIENNISIVPKLKKWPKEKIKEKIIDILKIVKLSDEILRRYPQELSGGQRQRIGVARAIITEPKIILMDEPFGALDPITREELQEEFINLKKEIKKTIVFVTHDIFEAFKIADRIAIMNRGKIIQIGSPAEIGENPVNDFVKKFMGKHIKALLLEFKNNNADRKN